MNAFKNASALCLAFAASALATMAQADTASDHQASADTRLNALAADYHHLQSRGEWQNRWLPRATGSVVAGAMSADEHMRKIISGYDRKTLDRGGWMNPYMTNSGYSAGSQLLAAEVGSGITELAGKASLQPVQARIVSFR